MRECIYCGRTLEKDEKCTCAMSVASRMKKENNDENININNNNDKQEKKKDTKKNKEKKKRERPIKVKRTQLDPKNSFSQAWQLFLSFIKSPIDTVMNPGEMSWVTIIILTAFEGIIGGLSVFSVVTGIVRGPIGFLGNALGFGGIAGYNLIRAGFLAAIAGAIIGIGTFFLYSTIFFVINKLIIRQFSPYREFVKRFVFAGLPITLLGVLSVLLGLFSQMTFIILLICGLVGNVIVTYEILRSAWYMKTPGKIMYIMLVCIFVFLMISVKFINIA